VGQRLDVGCKWRISVSVPKRMIADDVYDGSPGASRVVKVGESVG